MIIAGPCLMIDEADIYKAKETARALDGVNGLADRFRCKIIGGGTAPERFNMGIDFDKGLFTLEQINQFMPAGTEVHTPGHINQCSKLSFIWIGARNCQNYSLYRHLSLCRNDVFIKRGLAMVIDEVIGMYDIMDRIYSKKIYVIERGIAGIDRKPEMRWQIDLNSLLFLKNNRRDIFDRLVVDCSHSAGVKDNVGEIYQATKAIGIQHHMFEVTIDGISKTDQAHMLSVEELKKIIKEK